MAFLDELACQVEADEARSAHHEDLLGNSLRLERSAAPSLGQWCLHEIEFAVINVSAVFYSVLDASFWVGSWFGQDQTDSQAERPLVQSNGTKPQSGRALVACPELARTGQHCEGIRNRMWILEPSRFVQT